jgi:hypothetical protein
MPKPKTTGNKAVSYLLRILVAAGALYLAFRGEDLPRVAGLLSGLKLWVLALAITLYVISQLVFVSRWFLLLKVQSISIGFWTAVRLHLLGLFYNNCLPGAIAGDLPRAWYVTHHTDKKLQAVLSVFVDRFVGLTGIFIMAFFGYWFIPTGAGHEKLDLSLKLNLARRLSEYRWWVVGVSAVIVLVAAVFVSSSKGRALLLRIGALVRTRGAHTIAKVWAAIRIYLDKKLALVCALILTFCCQGIHVLAMWVVGREIGLDADLKYYFVFFPISWLLGALPISIGGLGIMEGWLKVMFGRVCAVSGGQPLALALAQRLIILLASLPGLVIHLIGAHLPKDFYIDPNDSIH